jgi:hypothetical protein
MEIDMLSFQRLCLKTGPDWDEKPVINHLLATPNTRTDRFAIVFANAPS